MDYINDRVLDAFNNDDFEKIEKYLLLGADPCVGDGQLLRYAVINNNDNLLSLLLIDKSEYTEKNKKIVKGNKNIVNLACSYNSINCVNKLYKYIDINDFTGTNTLKMLNEITGC